MSGSSVYSALSGHGTLLLAGVVGSTAYGLMRTDSDEDRLGVFAAPTLDLCGISSPRDSHVYSDPCDASFHEAGKFARLAIACNPTVTELLWLDDYEVMTPAGERLINIRNYLLSSSRVREAYLGYAKSQLNKLQKRADGTFSSKTVNRSAKHALHMARLINQGFELYTTGHLTIRVSDPDWYHNFGQQSPGEWTDWFNQAFARFSKAKTCLPDAPDTNKIVDWLNAVRLENLPVSITRRLRVWMEDAD